uniref:Cation diffusion facilitator 1 n=1 Tax=Coccidioides posadasii RMSCC 3488 TaxID=454284 RepID=A0A0J6FEX3_COCPO|nr:cation diffusion facilitator 1 [Coccidioides posadasii RMSCC 3488]
MATTPEGQNIDRDVVMRDASENVPRLNQPVPGDDAILAINAPFNASAPKIDHEDPLGLSQLKKADLSSIKVDYPAGNQRKIKAYYTKQNALIDQFLQSKDEEALAVQDFQRNGGKVKWAVNLSFMVNFCLFIIQLYAAISTGSLSLFATAADAFMDLVSSIVMLTTSRMAARPKPHKYPVGRRRIETVGIILFCALMTTVAIQLIIESGRALGSGDTDSSEELHIIPLIFVGTAIFSKFCLFCYCFWLRRYPAARIFFIDHRNDLAVNVFGLVMSIVGDRFVWYLDPVGAICIALLILVSWVSTAFENVWLLVGKAAPREFVNKCIYVSLTHDARIQKVDTCRAYHSGELYYVEVDVIMDPTTQLKDSHDVSQALQRKLEGLAAVERAFVHVDYEDDHNVHEEHKPLFDPATYRQPRTLKEWLKDMVQRR